MNLSKIERMVLEGDMSLDALRYMLNCKGECEWLDYKEMLNLTEEKDLCNFTKDVLAMKNVGGGYLIVGVQDKTWKPVGLSSPLPYDSKMIRDKIRKCADVELEVDIVHHNLQIGGILGRFALIYIRASKKKKKRRTPTLAGRDYCSGESFGLRRGDIYFRKGDSTIKIHNQTELEDLLDSLESQADEDSLIASDQLSPFAIENGTYRILETGFERFIGREQLKQDVMAAVTRDPRIWIVNVHGPGGVGKSALVNWAVYEFYHQKMFESIIQLTAKETILTPQGIMKFSRSLFSLENLLDHVLRTFEEEPPSDLEKKKSMAIEILCAWNTLLVLDNMETVGDGRIMTFIQNLPPDIKVKVLLTSRQKTGSWELPLPVNELSLDEVKEFIQIRSNEMGINCFHDSKIIEDVWKASGGLPLAIQWILGRCKLEGRYDSAIAAVSKKDSPVLEFSFGNIWKVLSMEAKAILAILSIFEEPPTIQQLVIATEFQIDRIEKALTELNEVTLVTRHTQISDGRVRYIALPITLSFAAHQLNTMGDFEINCRVRFQKFNEQMNLHESEISKFRNRFERYGLDSDNEKRAAILCQKGESEMFFGNIENADMLFKQARDLAPQSSYIYAMSASYELSRNRIGAALTNIEEACKRANKKTGGLCYTIKARAALAQNDRGGCVDALFKATEFNPTDPITRHQYGVALSRAGHPEDAIKQFNIIIEEQKKLIPPTTTLLMALKTRMINLRRLNRIDELKEDQTYLSTLFDNYPHLASARVDFDEFSESRNGMKGK